MLLLLAACAHPPDADAPPGDTTTMVMSTLSFAHRADDGTTWGFDLDDRVSDANDAQGCHHADLVDEEGHTGIDSTFSGMLPALEATEAGAVETLVQDSVESGELLLMVEVSGIDDRQNDSCVDVRILRGVGTPMIGTDGALLDGQTFALDPDAAPIELGCMPLVDGTVQAGPFDLTLDLQVLDVALTFDMHDAQLRLDMDEEGLTGWGYFGGAVPNSDLLVIVEEGDLADIADLVTSLVTAAADLNPVSGECQDLSLVFEYTGIEAFTYAE